MSINAVPREKTARKITKKSGTVAPNKMTIIEHHSNVYL